MEEISNALFNGGSGKQYRFEIYMMDAVFRTGTSGVYVFGRRYKLDEGHFTIDPLYIRKKDNFSTIIGYHPKQTCLEQHGCNCKCIYTTYDEGRQDFILEDLLEYYNPPC